MLTFSYANGIYKAKLGDRVLGQAKSMESLLENICGDSLPNTSYFMAAEVLLSLLGDAEQSGQIHTREA